MSTKKLQQIINTLETELKETKRQQNIEDLTDVQITKQIKAYQDRIQTMRNSFPEELNSMFMQPHLQRWLTALEKLKAIQQERN